MSLLHICVSDKIEKELYYKGESSRSAQYRYLDSCIKIVCITRPGISLGRVTGKHKVFWSHY